MKHLERFSPRSLVGLPNFEELLHGGLWNWTTCKGTSENDFLFFFMACASYL